MNTNNHRKIRLLHLADIHLGMENYGTYDPKTGLNSRLFDFLKCFDFAIDYAFNNKIDLVLFAGDAYKSRDPSPTYVKEFSKRIYKLASGGIPTVLIPGNHDLPSITRKASALDIFKALEIKNVYVSRKPEVIKISLKNQEIQVATLPWFTPQMLLDLEERKKKSAQELYQLLNTKIVQIIENLTKQTSPEIPAVFLGHISVAGALFGSEQKITISKDIAIPLYPLTKSVWQYAALGHIHKYQILNENPPVIYSGSIDRIDFGEEKEGKGFVEVGINKIPNSTFSTSFKFISVPSRKFLTIKVDLENTSIDPNKTVLDVIQKYELKNKVVRTIISGPANLLEQISEKEIKKALSQAYFIARISKEKTEEEREKKGFDYTEEMTPLDALGKYFEAKKMGKEKIKILKEKAEEIIKNLE